MVLLVNDLREQGFVVSAIGTGPSTFGLMQIDAPTGQLVGIWTDDAYRRQPLAIVGQVVRTAEPFGFRIPPA